MTVDRYRADTALPIYRYLDLSTSHTRRDELDILVAITSDALGPRTIGHRYGAWVNVPTESAAEAEERLEPIVGRCPHAAACLRYARRVRCTWVNFDADAGQVDELEVFDWGRELGIWQQGLCGSYAIALQQLHPGLRFGIAGCQEPEGWRPEHYFAHDDNHAYDSLGRHPLPYRGLAGDWDVQELDEDPDDWGIPEEEDGGKYVPLALEHARLLHSTLLGVDCQT